MAKRTFKYPFTTNRETSFSIFAKSNLLVSIPNSACLYKFKFLNPLKTVIPALKPTLPPKKVVLADLLFVTGSKLEPAERLPPELALTVGKKFPLELFKSVFAISKFNLFC